MNKFLLSITSLALAGMSFAQMGIATLNVPVTEDFNNFGGEGLATAPASNQLDSDTWRVTGMSDGDGTFGADFITGDYARGGSNGAVGSGGLYSFFDGTDSILGIQPGGSDWTPGDVTLKIQNNTGATITSLEISYNVWVLNDQARANSFNFAHSSDDVSYTNEASLDFTSTEAADGAPVWVETNRSLTISSLNITAGSFYYLQWLGDDVTGSGSRDEFGLDDISITAQGGVVTCTQPDITALADTNACDSLLLPEIMGTDLTGNEAYYTEMNGGGTSYVEGDYITSSMTLYMYDADGACTEEESFEVTVALKPEIDAVADVTICDSLELPAITGANLTNDVAYFIGLAGTSTTYDEGDFVNTTQTLYVYDSVFTGCTDQDTFEVVVNMTPSFDLVGAYVDCDSILVPTIGGNNLSGSQSFYTEMNAGGSMVAAGSYIYADVNLYAFDESGTMPNCVNDQIIIFDIQESLLAGADHDTTIASSSIIDLDGVIDEDNGGIIIETTMPASGQLNNFEFDANGLADGIYTFEYITDGCIDDTAVITVTVEDPINAIDENGVVSFNFYPNPATSVINVSGAKFTSYAIIDLAGRVKRTEKANNAIIPVEDLVQGIYFLELTLENNQKVRKRFVKK